MITIKDQSEINKMGCSGAALAELFDRIQPLVVSGMTTLDLDSWIEKELAKKGLKSQSKGYMGYQYVSCISVNDEVVHGIPSEKRVLKDGDLVKIDVCAALNGYCADMARTFFVGLPAEGVKKFVDVAQSALCKGIEMASPGNRLSDISAAVQNEVERHGYGVIRDFAGHGIGKTMHEDPEVLNYGSPGQGPLLRPGMTLAIEPMITMGCYKVKVAGDGWTVKTIDNSLAAHVEDTVVISENGPRVLTRISGEQ